MKRADLSEIQNKVSEAKALFVLGQRIIPVLEEVFQFVYEMEPLFEEINLSIKETSSKMPKASDKIINISNATEIATSEILDHLDEIFRTVENMIRKKKEEAEKMQPHFKAVVDICKKLGESQEHASLSETLLTHIQGIYKYTLGKKISSEWQQDFDRMNLLTNKILMALQFQDITSQQLQAANHLIIQVQKKMSELLEKLGNVADENMKAFEIDKNTFNENAEFRSRENEQKIADELEHFFSEQGGGLSQEEIDRLASEALNEEDDQGK